MSLICSQDSLIRWCYQPNTLLYQPNTHLYQLFFSSLCGYSRIRTYALDDVILRARYIKRSPMPKFLPLNYVSMSA